MEPLSLPADEMNADPREGALPIEVTLLTQDHEIRGLVYVSRSAKEERRLTDLLNESSRRFLAITDAELHNRHAPSGARHYAFMQVHIDQIIMLHPSTQSLVNKSPYNADQFQRFEQFRNKVRQQEQEVL
jgi:hypothetical protein